MAAASKFFTSVNQMATLTNVFAMKGLSTGAMTGVYTYALGLLQKQNQSAALKPFTNSNLSIVIPCQATPQPLFVAFSDTNIWTLGGSMEHSAVVFVPDHGTWKAAAVVAQPATATANTPSGWPSLCVGGSTRSSQTATIAPSVVASTLSGALTQAAASDPAGATAAVSPFALDVYTDLAPTFGPGMAKDKAGGVTQAYNFQPSSFPAYVIPLANGGDWVITSLVEKATESAPAGTTSSTWPDGGAISRPPNLTTVHQEETDFSASYSVVDPSGQGAQPEVDGFFGFQASQSVS